MNDALADEVLAAIPESLRNVSGSVLYSGRDAWKGSRPVYLLGYNPGGDPTEIPLTVVEQAAGMLAGSPRRSAYVDEEWAPGGRVRPAGAAPLQRSVRHLISRLGLAPYDVPASNMIYARSRTISDLDGDAARLADECWPFHATMIERLQISVVVCFGGDVARFVRSKLNAHTVAAVYSENNARGWTSRLFSGPGPSVAQMTHPGRANWTNPASDPTGLVVEALAAG